MLEGVESGDDYGPVMHGGNNPGDMRQALAGFLTGTLRSSADAFNRGKEVFTQLIARDGEAHEVSSESVVTVEPSEEAGNFFVHLKDEVAENKVKVIVVTGAALVASAAVIYRYRRSK